MKINKENYEAYFLDYLENKLQPELVAELMVFLEQNPNLKQELDSFENISLAPDNSVHFDEKKSLLKAEVIISENINETNYEEVMVAKFEGDLSDEESNELHEFLAINPKLKLEYNLLNKTFLSVPEINYQDKDSLKKGGVWLLYSKQIVYALSAAASILLLVGLWFILDRAGQNKFNFESARFEIQKMDQNKFLGFRSSLNDLKINPIQYNKPEESLISPEIELTTHQIEASESLAFIPSKTLKTIKFSEQKGIVFIKSKYTTSEMLAVAVIEDVEDEQTKKSFLSRFLAGATKNVIPDRNRENKSFLEYSVQGYNILADREVEVEKELDKEGNIVAYNVKGGILNFSRKVKNPTSE